MFDNEYLIHWWTEVQRFIFVTLFNYKQVKNELICIKQVSQNIQQKILPCCDKNKRDIKRQMGNAVDSS